MIFIKIQNEKLIQVDDKTRIDCTQSFVVDETVTKLEIQPSETDIFYDVTETKYLDWIYETDGEKIITVRINDTLVKEAIIDVISKEDDALYTTDEDLLAVEPDILKWVRQGRSSFLDVHREAKARIVAYLRFKDISNDVEAVQDIKDWSKFLVLQLIYESLSNAIDDIFAKKAEKYKAMVNECKTKVREKIDVDGDDVSDVSQSTSSVTIGRV